MAGDAQPETELCRLEVDGAVANVTLDRTDAFNALNPQLISDISEILEWTSRRSVGTTGELHSPDGAPNLRALVIRAEGKHFCAGADINMMREGGSKTPEENRADSERLDRLFHGLWSHPCFTIAAVQGVALGGGAGLVSCTDHVIAEPRTRIALSESALFSSGVLLPPSRIMLMSAPAQKCLPSALMTRALRLGAPSGECSSPVVPTDLLLSLIHI